MCCNSFKDMLFQHVKSFHRTISEVFFLLHVCSVLSFGGAAAFPNREGKGMGNREEEGQGKARRRRRNTAIRILRSVRLSSEKAPSFHGHF